MDGWMDGGLRKREWVERVHLRWIAPVWCPSVCLALLLVLFSLAPGVTWASLIKGEKTSQACTKKKRSDGLAQPSPAVAVHRAVSFRALRKKKKQLIILNDLLSFFLLSFQLLILKYTLMLNHGTIHLHRRMKQKNSDSCHRRPNIEIGGNQKGKKEPGINMRKESLLKSLSCRFCRLSFFIVGITSRW